MNAGGASEVMAVRRLSDLAAAGLALAGAYWLRFESGWVAPAVPPGANALSDHLLTPLPIALVLSGLAFQASGLYRPRRTRRLLARLRRLAKASGLALVLLMAATFLYRGESYSRIMAASFAALLPICLVGSRLLVSWLGRALRARKIGLRRALLVGAGAPLQRLAKRLAQHPQLALDVVGYVSSSESEPDREGLPERLAGPDGLLEAIQRLDVHEVFLALPSTERDRLQEFDRLLTGLPVDVRLVPDLEGCALVRPEVSALGDLPVITLRQGPQVGLNALLKRAFDVLGSSLLLLLSAPLLLAVALAVRLTSPGPILYRQERVGWGGHTFTILKFRTMCEQADQLGPSRTARDDPRRTPLGVLLRRTSVDELPQLLNVLRGDMSLVGPRPEPVSHFEQLEQELPGFMLRQAVRAGMTGWAQVHGLRGDAPLGERLRLDLDYIRRWSLGFDLKILFLTLFRGFVHPNAF